MEADNILPQSPYVPWKRDDNNGDGADHINKRFVLAAWNLAPSATRRSDTLGVRPPAQLK